MDGELAPSLWATNSWRFRHLPLSPRKHKDALAALPVRWRVSLPRTHNRTGRSRRDTSHVRLYRYMLRSAAWRSLTPQQRVVYLELENRHNGTNNGFIGLSVREAEDACNISKNTAAACLKVLVERGFIHCTRPGAFTYKKRHASEWELTAWQFGDELPKKDFMRWQPCEKKKPRS